ncbi:hypothetical protein ESZ53_05510 [Salinibacterium sp. UTAS2018]|uniref:hypothetical protein n=1 Tax=Salinibacterium sp. UTAS2018 TaxID=2508880 RepID=UPI0010095CCB|nr:hypothetical protein [Salinibacterium sp. UTAS2018]QAV69937.1 hypothetical protein ESZ53_05510 [Salinibacterium sp. UTAS2018]
MSVKKLLAGVASLTLTTGAFLGVSAPAFADDSSLVSNPVATQTIADVPATQGGEPAPSVEPASPQPKPDPEEQVPAASEVLAELAPAQPAPSVKPAPVNAAVTEAAPESSAADPEELASEPADAEPEAAPEFAARSVQPESQSRPQDNKKVWVCKFVASENSPSGYRLKLGKQPIHVSKNALGNDVNTTGDFNDRQPSFVVAEDDSSLCSRTVVTVDEEVVCPSDDGAGVVNITTSTTLFYGTKVVKSSQTTSTRHLTEKELVECEPPPVEVYVCQFVPSKSHPSGWVLAPGTQPVLMWDDALEGVVNATGDFDPETPSFIVASDDSALCASKTVERSTAIACPAGDDEGFATTTIVRSFFYGSIKVKERTVEKVRELTEDERADCPEVGGDVIATAAVSFVDATCAAPQELVLGSLVNAVWGAVTDPEGADNYSVTATAINGAHFPEMVDGALIAEPITTLTFSGVLNPQLDAGDPECEVVMPRLVLPVVSFTQATCDVDASYTLGAADGYDHTLVTFTVNGEPGILSGTYTVKESGSVAVTADPVEPNELEADWSDPAAFEFVAITTEDCVLPSAVTAQLPTLPTLAYTGGGGSSAGWWLVPLSMIVLGGAAVIVRRRMDADAL